MRSEGIDLHRKAIANIDRTLIRLLRKRILMVERTWATKVALGLPLVDEDQEEKVIRRAQKWASYYALSPRVVERIFKEILVEGKRRANPAGTVRSRKQTRTVPASTRSRRTKRDAR